MLSVNMHSDGAHFEQQCMHDDTLECFFLFFFFLCFLNILLDSFEEELDAEVEQLRERFFFFLSSSLSAGSTDFRMRSI